MDLEKILSKYKNKFNEETICTDICAKKFKYLDEIKNISGLPKEFTEFVEIFIKYPNYYFSFLYLDEYKLMAEELTYLNSKKKEKEFILFSWNNKTFTYNNIKKTYCNQECFSSAFLEFYRL